MQGALSDIDALWNNEEAFREMPHAHLLIMGDC